MLQLLRKIKTSKHKMIFNNEKLFIFKNNTTVVCHLLKFSEGGGGEGWKKKKGENKCCFSYEWHALFTTFHSITSKDVKWNWYRYIFHLFQFDIALVARTHTHTTGFADAVISPFVSMLRQISITSKKKREKEK